MTAEPARTQGMATFDARARVEWTERLRERC